MVPASKGTSKVRRFQCGVCGTNFTLLKNAKRHYRCQHLNYYYWCKYCPNGKDTRRYTRREFLEDHFRLHHPDTLCEVAEVGKQVRTDEYNIVCVEICEDEEEEEEVGVELVTTTDANLAGRSTLEPASSRGAFEGSLLLHHAEQRERSETNARGNFINLADYHLTNESLPSGASVSGSVQKRMQRTSPVSEQSSKVRRLETERNMNLESDIPYADGILHERDVAPSATRWVSPSGQTLLSQATAPNQSALTTSRSQFSRHDGSFSGHPVLHSSSATTQDCLVIGSAIPPAAGKDAALTPSPPAAQPPIRHSSPQIASSSTKHHLGQSPVMQNIHHQLPKRPNHLLPNQRQHIGLANASGIGRNVSEEGNIVISSSDTTYRKQQRDGTQQHSREVLVTEGEVPAAAALSCKEIFEKYHDNISKYSKEINFKYDSSGKAVRRKIIKHVFVFGNSQSELSRQEYAETQTADRSASR